MDFKGPGGGNSSIPTLNAAPAKAVDNKAFDFTVSYYYFINLQDNIPTLGGGATSLSKPVAASNTGAGNDYLSMLGNNQNRQPRMRMGAGGAGGAVQQQPAPKPKPAGANIMSGLDELEGL